jgi:hypothetical protein
MKHEEQMFKISLLLASRSFNPGTGSNQVVPVMPPEYLPHRSSPPAYMTGHQSALVVVVEFYNLLHKRGLSNFKVMRGSIVIRNLPAGCITKIF